MKRVVVILLIISIIYMYIYASKNPYNFVNIENIQIEDMESILDIKNYIIPNNTDNLISVKDDAQYGQDEYTSYIFSISDELIDTKNSKIILSKDILGSRDISEMLNDISDLLRMVSADSVGVHCEYIDHGEYYTANFLAEKFDDKFDMESAKAGARLIAQEARSKYSNSLYDQVWYVNNWIVNNCEYDQQSINTYTPEEYSMHTPWQACGPIVYNRAVCSGYSRAFKLVMDELGIKCIIVSGEMGGVRHAWNQVLIDGYWYTVDTTANDPVFIGNIEPSLKDRVDASTARLFMDNKQLNKYGYIYNADAAMLGRVYELKIDTNSN